MVQKKLSQKRSKKINKNSSKRSKKINKNSSKRSKKSCKKKSRKIVKKTSKKSKKSTKKGGSVQKKEIDFTNVNSLSQLNQKYEKHKYTKKDLEQNPCKKRETQKKRFNETSRIY